MYNELHRVKFTIVIVLQDGYTALDIAKKHSKLPGSEFKFFHLLVQCNNDSPYDIVKISCQNEWELKKQEKETLRARLELSEILKIEKERAIRQQLETERKRLIREEQQKEHLKNQHNLIVVQSQIDRHKLEEEHKLKMDLLEKERIEFLLVYKYLGYIFLFDHYFPPQENSRKLEEWNKKAEEDIQKAKALAAATQEEMMLMKEEIDNLRKVVMQQNLNPNMGVAGYFMYCLV